MKNLSKILGVIILSLIINVSFAGGDKGYKIKFKIKGITDTIVYLGHYYGDKKFAVDTAQVNNKGEGVFSDPESLEGGIYFIIMPSLDNTFFELVVDKDQDFSLETDTTNFVELMKFKGSVENQVFNDYQKFMITNSKLSGSIRQALARNKNNADSTKYYKAKVKVIDTGVKDYWASIQEKHPDLLISVIIKSMQETEMPESGIAEDNPKKDSLEWVYKYNFYKDHYFDNLDFSDERILRTPIFFNKFDNFVKKVLVQSPDTLIKESRKFIKLAEQNDKIYRYVLVYMLNYYEESHLMGMDKLFVSIAEDYYLTGKADWADSTFVEKLGDRVKKLKPNLVGNIAPDMKLQYPDDRFVKMSEIEADYLVLIFWETNCGHCKKTVPKLYKEYKEKLKAKNTKVFAVYTQLELESWTNFIEQKDLLDEGWYNVYDKYHFSNFRNLYDIYSTPTIYLLDKDKKIIGKRLDVTQISNMIERLEKYKK